MQMFCSLLACSASAPITPDSISSQLKKVKSSKYIACLEDFRAVKAVLGANLSNSGYVQGQTRMGPNSGGHNQESSRLSHDAGPDGGDRQSKASVNLQSLLTAMASNHRGASSRLDKTSRLGNASCREGATSQPQATSAPQHAQLNIDAIQGLRRSNSSTALKDAEDAASVVEDFLLDVVDAVPDNPSVALHYVGHPLALKNSLLETVCSRSQTGTWISDVATYLQSEASRPASDLIISPRSQAVSSIVLATIRSVWPSEDLNVSAEEMAEMNAQSPPVLAGCYLTSPVMIEPSALQVSTIVM